MELCQKIENTVSTNLFKDISFRSLVLEYLLQRESGQVNVWDHRRRNFALADYRLELKADIPDS